MRRVGNSIKSGGEVERVKEKRREEREKMALQRDWHRKVGELTEKQKLQFLFIPEADFGSLSIKFSEGRKITYLHSLPVSPS